MEKTEVMEKIKIMESVGSYPLVILEENTDNLTQQPLLELTEAIHIGHIYFDDVEKEEEIEDEKGVPEEMTSSLEEKEEVKEEEEEKGVQHDNSQHSSDENKINNEIDNEDEEQ